MSDAADPADGTAAFELADRAAYLPAADALVVADLHLGRDDASNVEFPLGERERLPDRIAALCDRFDPATVVLAGDVLHAFDSVADHAREAFERVASAVEEAGAAFVPVAGNHDTMLAEVAGTEPPEEYRLDDGTVVCHGDALPASDAPRYVVGHVHPAIVIEGERRPCYLFGPAAGGSAAVPGGAAPQDCAAAADDTAARNGAAGNDDAAGTSGAPADDDAAATDGDPAVLVLPAFNRLTRGSTVNGARGNDVDSPLVGDLDDYRPAIRDPDADETLWFPPLGQFRRLL